ncbi:hypothetical protein B0J11DRAFT_36257 [Dendryphion nanum]|uniref:F-box domain-containing protein n=1 Tax=Dendryphion nanum TaxID=256645 RepID=A0A9P9EJ45_9PLEO|nr:hypothetical protein B0J11DRAFT_36257 [Dendryphion nanum]
MGLPPLLSLPPELRQNIIDRLELQDEARLLLTCRSFNQDIKPFILDYFLAAETKEWAITKQLFTCKGCVRFRRLLEFSDEMRKGKKGRNKPNAPTRLCLKCGVRQGLYVAGADVVIMGSRHTVGGSCQLLNVADNAQKICQPCSATGIRHRDRKTEFPDDLHFYNDCEYFSKSYLKDKHIQEIEAGMLDV